MRGITNEAVSAFRASSRRYIREWPALDRGTLRYQQPVFKTSRMPEMTPGSSTRGWPGLRCSKCGLGDFQASSDNQNKLFATLITQRVKSAGKYTIRINKLYGSKPRGGVAFIERSSLTNSSAL